MNTTPTSLRHAISSLAIVPLTPALVRSCLNKSSIIEMSGCARRAHKSGIDFCCKSIRIMLIWSGVSRLVKHCSQVFFTAGTTTTAAAAAFSLTHDALLPG